MPLELVRNGNVLGAGAQLDHADAIFGDIEQRNRLFAQLVFAGLDARQVEDLVDEIEQMLAGAVDIAGIFLVGRIGERSHDFGRHHLGKAEDGV